MVMSVNSKMTAIANAIRGKTGGTDPLTLDQMAVAIAGIETGGGGDTSAEDGILDGTISGEYTNNRVEKIETYRFYNAKKLTKVSFPKVTKVEPRAFCNCYALSEIDFPKLTTIGSESAFEKCGLTSVVFPSLTSCGGVAFRNNPMVLADFHVLASLLYRVFQQCQNLTTLILRTNSVCTLTNTNVFDDTPFASDGTGGTVYVPSALIESYKTATNWSTLYAAGSLTFAAIEGSEYE
jgi:hypothetical protein